MREFSMPPLAQIPATTVSGPRKAFRTSARRFSWVSSQPLGRPVVPEV